MNLDEHLASLIWEKWFKPEIDEVEIAGSYSCNAKCRHCYLGDKDNSAIIKKETADNIFGKLKNFKIENLLLSGGEVTIKPQVLATIRDSLIENGRDSSNTNRFGFVSNGLAMFQNNSNLIELTKQSLETAQEIGELTKREIPDIDISNDNWHLEDLLRKGVITVDEIVDSIHFHTGGLISKGDGGAKTLSRYLNFEKLPYTLTEEIERAINSTVRKKFEKGLSKSFPDIDPEIFHLRPFERYSAIPVGWAKNLPSTHVTRHLRNVVYPGSICVTAKGDVIPEGLLSIAQQKNDRNIIGNVNKEDLRQIMIDRIEGIR